MCTTVCRVCLVDNVKMFVIYNHPLLEMYEKLSSAKLNTAERPHGVCYICCSMLVRCCRFSEMARRSELILTDMLDEGIEVTEETILMVTPGVKNNVIDLSVAPMQFVAANECESIETSAVAIKEELLVVKQENTLYEDKHFPEESAMHNNNIMEDSINKQYFFEKPTNLNIIMEQCNEYTLDKHLSPIHNEDTEMVSNTSCIKSKQEKKLVQQCQSKKTQYSCNHCNRIFINKRSLITHMEIHNETKPYTCKECDKSFGYNSRLKAHMRQHTGEKPYTCKECDKSFGYSSNLKTHMRRHTEERPYTCKECDKSFGYSSNLKTHMRRHTEERPYTCKECDKSFYDSHYLKTHMREHTGEKPYTCKECDKSFNYSSDLKRHMRLHTGGKPYKCEQCDKGFSRKDIFMKHIHSHTK